MNKLISKTYLLTSQLSYNNLYNNKPLPQLNSKTYLNNNLQTNSNNQD